MNKTHINRLATAFLLPVLLFSVACESGPDTFVGPKPKSETASFTIKTTNVIVSSTRASGTFEALGSIADIGTVIDDLDMSEPLSRRQSVHGTKTMESATGTIKISFYASLSPAGLNRLNARGGFSIVEGTGAYETLAGGGAINMEVASNASPDEIAGVLTGVAHYN